MTQNLKEHHASVTVNAPIHQVYSLFTHFNDFPKFMSFVNEVTYYDEQHSHWVANVVGRHEWDAVRCNGASDNIESRRVAQKKSMTLDIESNALGTNISLVQSCDPPTVVNGRCLPMNLGHD